MAYENDPLAQDTAQVDLFGDKRTDVLEDFGALAGRFTVPPFSVLEPRQGYWQQRKRLWVKLGIKGEEGRQDIDAAQNICSPEWNRGKESEFYTANPERCDGHGLSESQERLNAFKSKADPVPGGGPHSVRRLAPKDAGRCFGQDIMKGEHVLAEQNVAADKGYSYAAQENAGLPEKTQRALGVYAAPGGVVIARGHKEGAAGQHESDGEPKSVAGTSVFDPVLCECMYRWYVPQGGKILDPFAGGSTRGIVANYLGYDYTGVEIRQGQIDANVRQAQTAIERSSGRMAMPTWIHGDSTNLTEVLDNHDPFSEYDFLFACPPYYDLEIYSSNAGDGSTHQTYAEFLMWYKQIFAQAVARLKWNRFAAVVIGDIRRHVGMHSYQGLEHDTILTFQELGCYYYNRFVLVTAVGSLPVRIGAQFPRYRKNGNTHQMIYVFWKGDDDHKQIPAEIGVLPKEAYEEKSNG